MDIDDLNLVYADINDDELDLKLDDTITYKCCDCGMCCCNKNQVVFMSPLDILRLSKYEGIDSIDVAGKYCAISVDPTTLIPTLILDFTNGRCPFVKANPDKPGYICSLPDDYKPLECFTKGIFFASRMLEDGSGIETTVIKKMRKCTNESNLKTDKTIKVTDIAKSVAQDRYIDIYAYAKLLTPVHSVSSFFHTALKMERCMKIIAQINPKMKMIEGIKDLDIFSSIQSDVLYACYDYDDIDGIEDVTEEFLNEKVDKIMLIKELEKQFKESNMDSFIIDNFEKIFGVSVDTCLAKNIDTPDKLMSYIKKNGTEISNSASGILEDMLKNNEISGHDIDNDTRKVSQRVHDMIDFTIPFNNDKEDDDTDDKRNTLRD